MPTVHIDEILKLSIMQTLAVPRRFPPKKSLIVTNCYFFIQYRKLQILIHFMPTIHEKNIVYSAQYNDLVPNGENCLNTVLLLCYDTCEIINCMLTLKKNCISMAKQRHFVDVNSTLKVNVEIRLPPKAFLLLCYDTDIHTLSQMCYVEAVEY